MKGDYEFWLEERRSWFCVGENKEVSEFQFSRPTHQEFRNDLCELFARYPAKVRNLCDPSIVAVIWTQVQDVFDDSRPLRTSELPADIVKGSQKPLVEEATRRIYEDGIEANAVCIAGKGVQTGFRWMYSRHRFHLGRDYQVDANCRVIGMSMATVLACTKFINPQLAQVLAEKVKITVPTLVKAVRGNARRREMDSHAINANEVASWELAAVERGASDDAAPADIAAKNKVAARQEDRDQKIRAAYRTIIDRGERNWVKQLRREFNLSETRLRDIIRHG